MDNNCRFQVIDHPLIRHKLTYIRDRLTGKKEFKELVDEVAMLMAFEITRDFSLEKAKVQTPLMETDCEVLGDLQIVLVPILRAGIGMV
ncbi:MAG: uracil phosphoribosyltransferase, partial [Acidobacteria bacterium CG_4_9_14_3_um_filter_49_7]